MRANASLWRLPHPACHVPSCCSSQGIHGRTYGKVDPSFGMSISITELADVGVFPPGQCCPQRYYPGRLYRITIDCPETCAFLMSVEYNDSDLSLGVGAMRPVAVGAACSPGMECGRGTHTLISKSDLVASAVRVLADGQLSEPGWHVAGGVPGF